MKSILITGVSGFLGGYVAQAAKDSGLRVFGLDRGAPEAKVGRTLDGFTLGELDASSLAAALAVQKPQFCVHCAGGASVPSSLQDPDRDFENGPRATFKLLDLLRRRAPDCRVVFLSSAAVYGNPESLPVSESAACRPMSPYGWHKWMSELVCQEFAEIFKSQVLVARVFSAYGVGLRKQVLWDLCGRMALPGEVVLQGTGRETRDFIHACDVAQAVLLVLRSGGKAGTVYNVGSGKATEIGQLAEWMNKGFGDPKRMVRFSGILPQGTPAKWRADISQLRTLGFEPRMDVHEGVCDYVKWWQGLPAPAVASN